MLLSLAELGLKHFFLLLKLEKKNAVSSRGFESFTCNFFLSNCCSREREIVRNSIWISWCLKYIYIALVHNEKKASSFFISLLKSVIIIWDFSLRVRFCVLNISLAIHKKFCFSRFTAILLEHYVKSEWGGADGETGSGAFTALCLQLTL